jgi:hypothetical protein
MKLVAEHAGVKQIRGSGKNPARSHGGEMVAGSACADSLRTKFARMFHGKRDLELVGNPSPGTHCLLHHTDHPPVLARYDGRQEVPFINHSLLQFSLLTPTPERGGPFTSCLGVSLVECGYYRATPA